ncbi:O-antigen ligase family protein [uncultured Aquimarina sp.]|uniref:O-antigen ligase family protein n=1 Tax=uncultured Aquimarina sp. TaxID=575652 RepID=UPI00263747ED|nr:O-antigen ligase family protein [uncultured Aquimarina sp.]
MINKSKIKSSQIGLIFLYLGIFFIPFNSFEGIGALGEFRNESAAYFFFIGFMFVLSNFVKNRQIFFPYKSELFKYLLLFLFWCAVTTILNIYGVSQNYYKQTPGIYRFIRQYFSLLLSSFAFLLFYLNVLRHLSVEDILLKIRKVFLCSLTVASVYGFFEILITFFKKEELIGVLTLFNYFPFLEVVLHGYERISSISYEPPWLAIYLITISAWMFSYIITEKGAKKFVPAILVLVLTFFSGSRTGLFVVSVQVIIFFGILFSFKKYRKYVIYFLGCFFLIGTILIVINGDKVSKEVTRKLETLDFIGNLTENVSNKSRFGMQYASLQVFAENPIIGVGFGQQTYYSRFHYPNWATKDNYEFDLFYKNQYLKSFPPGYNVYTRVMAETGLIGIFIFLLMAFMIIAQTLLIIKNSSQERKVLAIILLVSFIGFYINWLQIDTFRLYGFWLSFAVLIIIIKHKRDSSKNGKNSQKRL